MGEVRTYEEVTRSTDLILVDFSMASRDLFVTSIRLVDPTVPRRPYAMALRTIPISASLAMVPLDLGKPRIPVTHDNWRGFESNLTSTQTGSEGFYVESGHGVWSVLDGSIGAPE